jgi:hypothetical protein
MAEPYCPSPNQHYLTEVNKASIHMQSWQRHLNDMYARGWRLDHVFEQDGNTVQVFVHHWHPDGFRPEERGR